MTEYYDILKTQEEIARRMGPNSDIFHFLYESLPRDLVAFPKDKKPEGFEEFTCISEIHILSDLCSRNSMEGIIVKKEGMKLCVLEYEKVPKDRHESEPSFKEWFILVPADQVSRFLDG